MQDELFNDPWPDVDDRLALSRAIERLPTRYRDVLTLMMRHDCTQQQIAERLGIAQSTVAYRYAQAIARLREILC